MPDSDEFCFCPVQLLSRFIVNVISAREVQYNVIHFVRLSHIAGAAVFCKTVYSTLQWTRLVLVVVLKKFTNFGVFDFPFQRQQTSLRDKLHNIRQRLGDGSAPVHLRAIGDFAL